MSDIEFSSAEAALLHALLTTAVDYFNDQVERRIILRTPIIPSILQGRMNLRDHSLVGQFLLDHAEEARERLMYDMSLSVIDADAVIDSFITKIESGTDLKRSKPFVPLQKAV